MAIFDTGEVNEPQLSAYPVRWVAVRGGAPDWAIYFAPQPAEYSARHSREWVKTNGDKITEANLIQNLVPCDKEVLQRYRL